MKCEVITNSYTCGRRGDDLRWSRCLLLGACSRGESASADPYAPFRPALKPNFQGDFDLVEKAPRYYLTVTMTPTGELLIGTALVDVTNYSPDPWRYLVFRLYPALQQYGGEMAIQSVAVDTQPTNFVYLAQNSAIRINLPRNSGTG